jgi:hypothetical protein
VGIVVVLLATALESASDVSVSALSGIVGIVVVLLAAAIVVAGFLRKLRRPELNGLSREKVKQLWEQIEASAKQGKLGQKIAVIEADKLVDNVLKSMLISGETMGERLKMAAYKYPQISDVWNAHRTRNRLVHETEYELREGDTKRTLQDFRRALQVLNVL